MNKKIGLDLTIMITEMAGSLVALNMNQRRCIETHTFVYEMIFKRIH